MISLHIHAVANRMASCLGLGCFCGTREFVQQPAGQLNAWDMILQTLAYNQGTIKVPGTVALPKIAKGQTERAAFILVNCQKTLMVSVHPLADVPDAIAVLGKIRHQGNLLDTTF